MIDFVKLVINTKDLPARLLENQDLTFERKRDRYTSRRFRDLLLTVHDSGRVEVAGSLHKYWNHGAHNWNDFSRVDLWDTIHDFCGWLQVDPSECTLHNLEFGVNIPLPFSPPELLRDLLGYKTYSFGRVSVPNAGTYYQARTFDCYVKCYDKGAQYDRPGHLLRFEVKVKSMRFLSGANVRTLQDLLTGANLAVLGTMLFEAWEFVLVREHLPAAELTTNERDTVETVTTQDLKTIGRRQRYKLLKEYRTLVERTLHGNGTPPDGTPPDGTPPDRKKVVAGLIRDQWERLTKGDVCNDPHTSTNIDKIGRSQRLGIVCKRPEDAPPKPAPSPPPRQCKTTGIDITDQKSDSLFIGERTAKERADEVKKKLGSRRRNKRKRTYHPEDYYNAHNARNDDSNPRNNLKRRVDRILSQPSCIDPWQFIKFTSQQQSLYNHGRNSTPGAEV